MPYSKVDPTRHFNSQLRADKFDRAAREERGLQDQGRSDVDNAPNEDIAFAGARHGIVVEHHYKVVGNGQHEVYLKFADGFEHTSRHPEQFRAHQIATRAMGLDDPPPAIRTHNRARAHPVGPKEDERLAREDHREVPSEPPEETEE